MLSKSLIQFSVDGWGCVPSLLLDLRPNYGRGNEDSGNLLLKVPYMHCYTQCPQPCSRPPPNHTSARASWILTSKSGSNSVGFTAPFPGSWCTQGFVFALQESISPVLCEFWWFFYGVVNGDLLQEGLFCTQSPCSRPLLTHTSTGQFSFQFKRKAMPKNVQTTTQLHSSHTLVK